MILKVNYNINYAIHFSANKIITVSLFGERDNYNVAICQSSCDKGNVTRPRLLV